MTFFFFIAKQLFLVLLATIVCSGAEKLFMDITALCFLSDWQSFCSWRFCLRSNQNHTGQFYNHFWTRSSASEKLCRHFSDNDNGINPEYWSGSYVFMACFIWYSVMKQNKIAYPLDV